MHLLRQPSLWAVAALCAACSVPPRNRVAAAAEPPALPTLARGARFSVTGARLSLPFPEAEDTGRQVVQVELRSDAEFSCELVWSCAGERVYRVNQERACRILLSGGHFGCSDHPNDPDPCCVRHTLHLWTEGPEATLTANVVIRPVVEREGVTIPAGKAVSHLVERRGAYRTGPGVYCASEVGSRVLWPCGPETYLDVEPMVFTVLEMKEVPLLLEPLGGPGDGAPPP